MYTAIWAYPWDFLDEGIDSALGRIADAGLEGVSVAAAYHTVRTLSPHNPRSAVYHGEGGVVYFRPDSEHFEESRIKPVQSVLNAEGDSLNLVGSEAVRRGLKLHAWTVLTHNTRLGSAYPDCSVENPFGDRYPFGLCPANPDVRAYAVGLVKSLADREEVATIEIESLGYMGINHTGHHSKQGIDLDPLHTFLLSVCFCPHCSIRMESHGANVVQAREAVVSELRGFFAGQLHTSNRDPLDLLPEILGEDTADAILVARDEAVLTLLEELYWLVKKPQTLSVMVTGSPLSTGAQAGITLSEAREWTDILLTQAFSPSPTEVGEQVSEIAVRRGSAPLYCGLQATAPMVRDADALLQSAKAARDAGADGLQFYHYGLMPLANLEWIRAALSAI